MTQPRWVDNHCHLDPGADGLTQIEAARAVGVERLIDVGTDAERSRQAVAAAALYPGVVFATVGVHPHDADQGVAGLAEMLSEPGVVAVGECGLDYHYEHSPRDAQCKAFAAQIALAHTHDLPLVVHTREAWDETFAILDTEGVPTHTVLHCFTGGPAEAEAGLGRGMHVSFSGIVTFKSATSLRDALMVVPTNRMMVETDSPFLAPEPVRGKPNSPANLPLVGARMARELGMTPGDLAADLWATTHAFYKLPPEPFPEIL